MSLRFWANSFHLGNGLDYRFCGLKILNVWLVLSIYWDPVSKKNPSRLEKHFPSMHKTQHWGGQRSCLCRSREKSTDKSVVNFNFNKNLRTQDETYWNSTTCLAYIRPSLLFLAVNEWMNKWMKEILTFEPCKCIGKKMMCYLTT